jgi:putative ABC transport system ATP-binding protein
MIEINDVSKVYGRRQHQFVALKDINLVIEEGRSVAIVGKSGSGKSTLMHIMSGLDHPRSGTVTIDDQDIFSFKQKQIDAFRASKIGFIFQNFFLEGSESVANNVSLPLEIANISHSQRRARIVAALKAVEMEDKINNRARDLSGGQRQRLVIARAIVNDPSILFADEPTGNLDSQTGEKIEQLLFNLNKKKGVTLIIVTHDSDLAAKCDMQVHIKDGRIQSVIDSKKLGSTARKGRK